MKSIARKLTAVVLVAAIAIVSVFAFAACGTPKATGVYLSPAQLSYANMRPTYNYYMTTFTQQELTLYEDNTYCLIVSSSMFSALELPAEGNAAKGNERDNSITKYYGTFTSEPNALDEDLMDVTLATPTHIVVAYDGSYYLDTDNWNDDMGRQVVPGTIDTSTGQVVKDPDATPWTAEQYLADAAFNEAKAQLNVKQYSFDFIDLTFPENDA